MRKVYRYLPDGRTVVTYRSERPTMLKTYRITFRSEVFIQAPDAAAAQLAFEAGDAGEERALRDADRRWRR